MANEEHLAILKQGVDTWNAWRKENHTLTPDLRGAKLSATCLSKFSPESYDIEVIKDMNIDAADLSQANLENADLSEANLIGVNFSHANLCRASLFGSKMMGANFAKANLERACLMRSILNNACFDESILIGAEFNVSTLVGSNFKRANLSQADFHATLLFNTNFEQANLRGANLGYSVLAKTNLAQADLTGCQIYGASAWDVNVEGAIQEELLVYGENKIFVDSIELGQFIYLLLDNKKIRDVIDNITSKVVLILGRFTPERKEIISAIARSLRMHNRTPVIFDFEQPSNKNITDTVKLLAQMARYIIVDLSDPNSSPYELGIISMLGLDSTPVVPLIMNGKPPFPMLADVLQKRWSTRLVTYQDLDDLMSNLDELIIDVAEAKVQELRGTR